MAQTAHTGTADSGTADSGTVETVRGAVPLGDLGRMLVHEHVFVLNEEIRQNYGAYWDEDQQVMDRFGLDILLPFERRVATVAALAGRGYAGSMVLSHDASCHIDWFPPELPPVMAPNWHFTHVLDDVLPALSERGVTGEQIDTMLVANPRRFFTRQK